MTTWIVGLGDDLYVRSAYGLGSAWFRAAKTSHRGRMKGAGAERGVSFTDTEPNFNDQIDAAYRTKYRRLGGGRRSTST